jgi:hypothetical protein
LYPQIKEQKQGVGYHIPKTRQLALVGYDYIMLRRIIVMAQMDDAYRIAFAGTVHIKHKYFPGGSPFSSCEDYYYCSQWRL